MVAAEAEEQLELFFWLTGSLLPSAFSLHEVW